MAGRLFRPCGSATPVGDSLGPSVSMVSSRHETKFPVGPTPRDWDNLQSQPVAPLKVLEQPLERLRPGAEAAGEWAVE